MILLTAQDQGPCLCSWGQVVSTQHSAWHTVGIQDLLKCEWVSEWTGGRGDPVTDKLVVNGIFFLSNHKTTFIYLVGETSGQLWKYLKKEDRGWVPFVTYCFLWDPSAFYFVFFGDVCSCLQASDRILAVLTKGVYKTDTCVPHIEPQS